MDWQAREGWVDIYIGKGHDHPLHCCKVIDTRSNRVGRSESVSSEPNGDPSGLFAHWDIENGGVITINVVSPASRSGC